jgi:hypothetical protein
MERKTESVASFRGSANSCRVIASINPKLRKAGSAEEVALITSHD